MDAAQSILIVGASGNVGSIGMHLARHSRSRVIATASHPGNTGWVMELDAAQALDHHQHAD